MALMASFESLVALHWAEEWSILISDTSGQFGILTDEHRAVTLWLMMLGRRPGCPPLIIPAFYVIVIIGFAKQMPFLRRCAYDELFWIQFLKTTGHNMTRGLCNTMGQQGTNIVDYGWSIAQAPGRLIHEWNALTTVLQGKSMQAKVLFPITISKRQKNRNSGSN